MFWWGLLLGWLASGITLFAALLLLAAAKPRTKRREPTADYLTWLESQWDR